ncbi:MAG TPA: hypothetical protein VLB68_11930 [Pyrinomonadaceae bacterium]|nr:hypothetical protein [Pyrinomonadaceae bacterium]
MNLNSLLRSSLLVWSMVVAFVLISGMGCKGATLRKQDGPPTPSTILRRARFIRVKSSSLLVGESVIENKLRKRPEFQQAGLLITRDENQADIILEVHHDLFTMYVFTAVDPVTNVVVASGKLSSLGGTVAGKVAKRFMKQVMRARS